MTTDTDTLAGLLARLHGQDPIPSRSEVADAIEALAAKDKARIERLEAALREIARQKRTDELETEYDVEVADFEGGYDACIDRARAALEDGE